MKQPILMLILFAIVFASCKKEPTASFEYTMDGTLAPCKVSFINKSSDATSHNWDFGDQSSSTEDNPIHEFVEGGNYPVSLTANGEGGENTFTQTITVLHSVTGKWDISITLEDETFDGELNLSQAEDGALSGDFVFTDGSGFSKLLSSSNVGNNNEINIDFWMGGTYLTKLSGLISPGYKSMSGKYTIGTITKQYSWSATKSYAKSVKKSNLNIKPLEKLMGLINSLK